MGSILQDKGGRKDLWYKYLQGFNHEDSTLWIPIKLNGVFIHKSKTTSRYGKEQIEKAKEKYSDLVEEITNHPSYDGHVYPDQIKGLIKDYKYSLVLRCVSFKDSLNFRPLFYTYMRILPFLDPQYDPQGMQIPLDIQKHLIVNDHNDIHEKIKYFNENPAEAQRILDELHKHFKIDEFLEDPKGIIMKHFEN